MTHSRKLIHSLSTGVLVAYFLVFSPYTAHAALYYANGSDGTLSSPASGSAAIQLFYSLSTGVANRVVIKTSPTYNAGVFCDKTTGGRSFFIELQPAVPVTGQTYYASSDTAAVYRSAHIAPDSNGFCYYDYNSNSGSGWSVTHTMTSGNLYYAYFFDQTNGFNDDAFYGSLSGWGGGYLYAGNLIPDGRGVGSYLMYVSDSTTFTPPNSVDLTTRFTTIIPFNGSTVATGTPVSLEALGYLNVLDAGLDTKIVMEIRNNFTTQSSGCADVGCLWGAPVYQSFTFTNFYPLDSPATGGSFDVSTTTTLTDLGKYNLKISIQRPTTYFGFNNFLGFGFGYDTLISTTTVFTLGTTTSLEQALSQAQQALATATASTSAAILNSCNPLGGFDISMCLAFLFLPSSNNWIDIYNEFKNGFLERAPWGYATRLVSILTNNAGATTTLPTLMFTMPSNIGDGGDTFVFNLEENFSQASTVLAYVDPTSGQTIRSLFEPWIQIFIAISVLIIIYHDVMLMGESRHRPSSRK